jgi:hypothetical protein
MGVLTPKIKPTWHNLVLRNLNYNMIWALAWNTGLYQRACFLTDFPVQISLRESTNLPEDLKVRALALYSSDALPQIRIRVKKLVQI